MKVLSIVGNRPQFIKSAPLSLALRDAAVAEVVVHTGQHYDREMSRIFFDELGLAKPAYELDLHTADADAMRPARSLKSRASDAPPPCSGFPRSAPPPFPRSAG